MTREVEAIFEHGVLRPVEPLSLAENQRVVVTIKEAPPTDVSPAGDRRYRRAEMEWLRANSEKYLGQWLALQGNQLLSHGPDVLAVLNEAHAKGVAHPLLHQVPDEVDGPSMGWL